MIVLIGKSSSGKTTIQEEIIKSGKFKRVVTYTSRPPRPGEVDGVDYYFLSSYEFLRKKAQGFFVETTSYKVADGGMWYYGTSEECLNDDNGVLIMNPDGLKAISNKKDLCFTSFYIYCNTRTLKKRLKKRGDNPKEARRRLKADKKDFRGIEDWCDYIMENGNTCTPKEVAADIIYTYNH